MGQVDELFRNVQLPLAFGWVGRLKPACRAVADQTNLTLFELSPNSLTLLSPDGGFNSVLVPGSQLHTFKTRLLQHAYDRVHIEFFERVVGDCTQVEAWICIRLACGLQLKCAARHGGASTHYKISSVHASLLSQIDTPNSFQVTDRRR